MPNITLTALQTDYDTSLPGFLRAQKIPTDSDTGEPTMSDAAWIKDRLKAYYLREAQHGLELLAQDAVTLGKVFE